MEKDGILEQYKTYIADVGNIGSRYATGQTFYLSVVTALIAIVAFIEKDGAPLQKYATFITPFILFFIALICYAWWQTLTYYFKLFGAKIAVLKEMEKKGALFPIYGEEWKELEKRGSPSLMRHERLIPLILGLAAAIGCIVLVWAKLAGLQIA